MVEDIFAGFKDDDGETVAGNYRAVLVVNGLVTGNPSAKMTAVSDPP
jgi:hypothetical protein